MIVFTLLLSSAVILGKFMRFELFPGDDVTTIFVQLKGPVGTPLEQTDRAMRKLEQIATEELKESEYEYFASKIGMLSERRRTKRAGHYASLEIKLTNINDRKRKSGSILEAIVTKAKKQITDFNVNSRKIRRGPPTGKPIDIQLSGGSNISTLLSAAKEINKVLQTTRGVESTEIDFEEGKQQVIADIDDIQVRRLGISTSQVALEMRRALSGDEISKIREADEDIIIRIALNKKFTGDELALLKMLATGPTNQTSLGKVAKFERRPGAFVIRRLNNHRVVAIEGMIDNKVTTTEEFNKAIRPTLEEIVKKYPFVRYDIGGEGKDTRESMSNLAKAGIAALACIFLVLVIMFNSFIHPIVVIISIPLGGIGVVLAFFVSNEPLGFMALMGAVALSGVVVNDSIILVNCINSARKIETNLRKAVISASKSRFRPVILTTVTTVFGLLPVAHPQIFYIMTLGYGGEPDPFIRPMALSFAWGLFFASAVTLVFIPCNYIIFERSKAFITRQIAQLCYKNE